MILASVPTRGAAIINVIAVGVITVAAFVRSLPHLTCLPIEPQWAADPGIAQALKGRKGRLAVEFNWGEYAIWHLGPQIRVSIDGRRETVYSDMTLATQRSLALGRPQGLEWLSFTKPEYLWFDASRVDLKRAAQVMGIAWIRTRHIRFSLFAAIFRLCTGLRSISRGCAFHMS